MPGALYAAPSYDKVVEALGQVRVNPLLWFFAVGLLIALLAYAAYKLE